MNQSRFRPQNDRLNLSFVKDKHTYGKKMARNGPTTVIYKGTFVLNQSLSCHYNITEYFLNISISYGQEIFELLSWWNSWKNMYCKKFYVNNFLQLSKALIGFCCKWDFKDWLSFFYCNVIAEFVCFFDQKWQALFSFWLQVKCLVGFELFDWCHAVSN